MLISPLQQAINILLQAVKETEESTSKKKKKSLTITRPIICICNDLYVPALRQLRQIALTLSVPQITPARLAQRLVEVLAKTCFIVVISNFSSYDYDISCSFKMLFELPLI